MFILSLLGFSMYTYSGRMNLGDLFQKYQATSFKIKTGNPGEMKAHRLSSVVREFRLPLPEKQISKLALPPKMSSKLFQSLKTEDLFSVISFEIEESKYFLNFRKDPSQIFRNLNPLLKTNTSFCIYVKASESNKFFRYSNFLTIPIFSLSMVIAYQSDVMCEIQLIQKKIVLQFLSNIFCDVLLFDAIIQKVIKNITNQKTHVFMKQLNIFIK